MIYDFLQILLNKIKLIGNIENENTSKIVFFIKFYLFN